MRRQFWDFLDAGIGYAGIGKETIHNNQSLSLYPSGDLRAASIVLFKVSGLPICEAACAGKHECRKCGLNSFDTLVLNFV